MATPRASRSWGKKKPVLYIRTYGCQMNNRDAELVFGLLEEEGYAKSETLEDADVVLFNTCSVRKHAEDRVYGKVGLLKGWKRKNPAKILGIIGCMAKSHKEEIFKKLPHVDFICGPANIYEIPNLILRRWVQSQRMHISALHNRQRPDIEQPAIRENPVTAYVSISEGCDNFCSYCIVPYVRGREKGRSRKFILSEIEGLARCGYREVTLLGQNVNSYWYKSQGLKIKERTKKSFVKLLANVNKIEGIDRIRFMTSHPKDATRDLFRAMRDLDKVCEHLHLPLQSGSDKILNRMNRNYTREKYLKLAEDFRKIVPQSSLTTDIIVGFPGESEQDFKKTYKIMEEIGFDNAFIFKYSPRPPAQSAEYDDDVATEVKKERNQILLRLQEGISRKRNEGLIGKDLEVLIEAENKKPKGKSLCGRTRTNKIVVFDGSKDLINEFVDVRIKKATPHTLIGEAISHAKK